MSPIKRPPWKNTSSPVICSNIGWCERMVLVAVTAVILIMPIHFVNLTQYVWHFEGSLYRTWFFKLCATPRYSVVKMTIIIPAVVLIRMLEIPFRINKNIIRPFALLNTCGKRTAAISCVLVPFINVKEDKTVARHLIKLRIINVLNVLLIVSFPLSDRNIIIPMSINNMQEAT